MSLRSFKSFGKKFEKNYCQFCTFYSVNSFVTPISFMSTHIGYQVQTLDNRYILDTRYTYWLPSTNIGYIYVNKLDTLDTFT